MVMKLKFIIFLLVAGAAVVAIRAWAFTRLSYSSRVGCLDCENNNIKDISSRVESRTGGYWIDGFTNFDKIFSSRRIVKVVMSRADTLSEKRGTVFLVDAIIVKVWEQGKGDEPAFCVLPVDRYGKILKYDPIDDDPVRNYDISELPGEIVTVINSSSIIKQKNINFWIKLSSGEIQVFTKAGGDQGSGLMGLRQSGDLIVFGRVDEKWKLIRHAFGIY